MLSLLLYLSAAGVHTIVACALIWWNNNDNSKDDNIHNERDERDEHKQRILFYITLQSHHHHHYQSIQTIWQPSPINIVVAVAVTASYSSRKVGTTKATPRGGKTYINYQSLLFYNQP